MTIATIILIMSGTMIAQEKMDHNKMGDTSQKGCCSSTKDSSSCMAKDKAGDMKSMSAKMIDKNLDGKVYQCSMCPDQLSDEPGKCPNCEMDLEEITVEEAQKSMTNDGHNMMEHGKMKSGDMMEHGKMKDHKMDHSKMKMMDMKHSGHDNMKMKGSMVREGIIDLMTIDKNGDKKVFQDQMDWNVISDEAGECPVCGMKLKEVSINEAKANLIKHNYKVK